MRRRFHGVDEGLPGPLTTQPSKIFRSDHHHLVAPVHRDMLGAFAAHTTHQFAEAGLGVLKDPMPRKRGRAAG